MKEIFLSPPPPPPPPPSRGRSRGVRPRRRRPAATAAFVALAASASAAAFPPAASASSPPPPASAFAPPPAAPTRPSASSTAALRLSSSSSSSSDDPSKGKSPGFGASSGSGSGPGPGFIRPFDPPGSGADDSKLSAAARARRDEERRRALRRDEVVPGRTSARPGERDYRIDPAATERLYLSGAGDAEREVYLQTERGMEALKMLQLEEAKEAFDAVCAIKPDAYLWQKGVVQYYLNDLRGARDTFASNAARYEAKFFCPASEERIWGDACVLRIESSERGKGKKGKSNVVDMAGGGGPEGAREGETAKAQIPNRSDSGPAPEMMSRETRKVIRLARDLFSASVRIDHSAVALSRASLRSICGPYGSPPSPDRKMWRLHSWYYLGLHYDATGETDESRKCMKMALRQSAAFGHGNGDDVVQTLPLLHMTRRDWFDDDDFEADEGAEADPRGAGAGAAPRRGMKASDLDAAANRYSWSALSGGGDGESGSGRKDERSERDAAEEANAFVRESVSGTVDRMKLTELQDALKRRELKSSGSKAELRRRLTDSLMREAGFE